MKKIIITCTCTVLMMTIIGTIAFATANDNKSEWPYYDIEPRANSELFVSTESIKKAIEEGKFDTPFEELKEYVDKKNRFFSMLCPLTDTKDPYWLKQREDGTIMKIEKRLINSRCGLGIFDLYEMHQCFPVEKMMFLNDDTIAAVTKLNREGKIYYAYSFFERVNNEVTQYTEKWLSKANWCIASPGKKWEDFSQIREGDSLEKLLEIDESMIASMAITKGYLESGEAHYIHNRMLDDGILRVYITGEQSPTITVIVFTPYSELKYDNVILPEVSAD